MSLREIIRLGLIFRNLNNPLIDNRVVCIVDAEKHLFATLISSYFSTPKTYLPVFLFPNVLAKDGIAADKFEDDSFISQMLGNNAATFINNAIARARGCEWLILAGLSESQKSYLIEWKFAKVIIIDDLSEIFDALKVIKHANKTALRCQPGKELESLLRAKQERKYLLPDSDITEPYNYSELSKKDNRKGLVIVEDLTKSSSHVSASTIVAINYAFSVGADIKIIEPLEKDEIKIVQELIQSADPFDAAAGRQSAIDHVHNRVNITDLTGYRFSTFFTEGLPYSFALKNIIPITHVNLRLRPDLFVYNAILFETVPRFNSALVFSPGFYKGEEETTDLIRQLSDKKFYLKSLLGSQATVHDLDFNVCHLPYDLLHICSHGGEVNGYSVADRYTDRKGIEHIVDFDEVVGFAPIPGEDLIAVDTKVLFRKLDGFKWMSKELKAQGFANYVFEDMRKHIFGENSSFETRKRNPKPSVAGSCAIACHDSIHQGMFRALASHSSPVVFNNACWSWCEVCTFFLANGCRAYIGTLWDIQNMNAVKGANAFYEHLFTEGIAVAVNKMNRAINNTEDADIYLLWGLHLSTLEEPKNLERSRSRVFREFIRSLISWRKKIRYTKSAEVKKNSIAAAKAIQQEILKDFTPHDLRRLDSNLYPALMEEID